MQRLDDVLSKDEADFVRKVFANPGAKLNWQEAARQVDDGSEHGKTVCLWEKPEALGLIAAVGSYKWKPTALLDVGILTPNATVSRPREGATEQAPTEDRSA